MKKLVSVLFVCLFAVSVFLGSLSAAQTTDQAFFLQFASSEDVPLAGIRADVYRKVNVVYHTDKLSTWEREFVCSATSDQKGSLSFEKPDGPFVVVLDLSTLPEGTGVRKSMLLYTPDCASDTVEIHSVASVEPCFVYGRLNFDFKSAENENLLVDFEVTSHHVMEVGNAAAEKSALSIEEASISCTIRHEGEVSVNGTPFSYCLEKEYTGLDKLQYVSLLSEEAVISAEEQAEMLCDILQRNGTKSISQDLIAKLDAIKNSTVNPELRQKLNTVLAKAAGDSIIDDPDTLQYVERTYICDGQNCSEGGVHHLRVYYCTSTCSLSNASLVADELLDVFEYFIGDLQFRCPPSSDNLTFIPDIGNSFCVILSSSISLGVTYSAGGQHSYMVVNPATISTLRYQTILAHEFQHSIQYQYHLTAGSKETWWKEACANWAAMLYADEILGDLSTRYYEFKDGIRAYLNSTEQSLMYNDGNISVREYSALLPILLYQAGGGPSAIRRTYEQVRVLRNTSASFSNAQIFSAIGTIMGPRYTLRDVLEMFGNYNYIYFSYYTWLRGASWPDVRITEEPVVAGSARTSEVENVGYQYYKLSSSPGTVNITIEASCEDPTQITCWIIEGFDGNKVANSTKVRLTGGTLDMNYTFVSALGEDLVLILENVSIENDSEITVLVN